MDYRFSEFLLLRSPLYSISKYQIDDLESIMTDQLFLSALYLASPDFFHVLEKKNFQPAELNEKEKITILKYYNRSCFRCTPFGLFSSISLTGWGGKKLSFAPTAGAPNLIVGPDRGEINRIGQAMINGPLAAGIRFETNPFLYRLGNEYRFLRSSLDDQFRKREHLLQSIAYSLLLKKLFEFSRTGKSRKQITEQIMVLSGCSEQQADDYFEFLTDAQILFNKLRPNISGNGYLNRLDDFVVQQKIQSPVILKPLSAERRIEVQKVTPRKLKQLVRRVQSLSFKSTVRDHSIKLGGVFERSITGGLESLWKDRLADGLFALEKLCPEPSNPAMDDFVRIFNKRFESQVVPLLEALDPDIGIGYFLQPADRSPLLETINLQRDVLDETTINWTAGHRILLNSWDRAGENGLSAIRLQKPDLEKLQSPDKSKSYLGSSVLFRTAGNELYIESAGGTNSLALFGRFTPGHPKILQAVKEISRQQEAANPELLFAEVLHLLNPHAENVAVRDNIWSWDIPLTGVSTQPAEKQLPLNDLYITVKRGKVWLWSKKHQKLVIPRHTSAYNHQLNHLPMFRFLADLAYQYGRSSLTLNLQQFFPGLKFYPRVSYQQCILHLATWVLNEPEIQALQAEQPKDILDAFTRLDRTHHFPAVFTLSEGDQELIFFKEKDSHVLFFKACLKSKKEVMVREFLLEPAAGCQLSNANGQPHMSQFSTALIPLLRFDPQVRPPIKFAANQAQRKFVPGSEWLYLKIYISRTATASLLSRIYPLLQKQYRYGKILKWFFIRYEDHAPHIRLRMRIDPKDTGEILSALKSKLENKINQHVIREYQVDVYSREIERYEGISYDHTENLFWASSELVYQWLNNKNTRSVNPEYLLAIRGVHDILGIFIRDRNEQAKFAWSAFEQFLTEFKHADIKRDLDKKFRGLSEKIRLALADDFYKSFHLTKPGLQFQRVLLEIDEQRSQSIPSAYLSDIIHMHLNRIFTTDSRKQEMIVYYFYYKILSSETARNKT